MHDPTYNTGLLTRRPQPKDFVLGGVTALPRDIVNQSGDWRTYRDDHEVQYFPGYDTMACVSFAACNVIEAMLKYQFDYRINFSDRALSQMSGTTKKGNYLSTVANTIRTRGLIPEDEWPYHAELTTWEEYNNPIPAGILESASLFTKTFKMGWEAVWYDFGIPYKDALLLSPLHIAMQYAREAWKDENGVYQFKGTSRTSTNHSTALLHIDADGYKYIQDTYGTPVKKLAPDYPIPYALRYHIEMRGEVTSPNIPTMKLPKNSLIIVKDSGERLMYVDGDSIYKDDAGKILLEVQARNTVEITGGDYRLSADYPIVHLFSRDIEHLKRINLKGESL